MYARRFAAHVYATEFRNRAPVLLTPDKAQMVMAGDDGLVHVVDLADGSVLYKLSGSLPLITDMVISADGCYLAAANKESINIYVNRVSVWNLQNGDLLHVNNGLNSRWIDLDLTPDSRDLLTVGGGKVHLWDLDSGEVAITLGDAGGSLGTGEVSPNGQLVVTTRGQRILLWDVSDLSAD